MTFTGDMKSMQVFYGLYGYGAIQSVSFRDITVTGFLFHLEQAVPEVPLGSVISYRCLPRWLYCLHKTETLLRR